MGPFSAPPGFLPFRPYRRSHWRCCCLFFLAVVVVVGVVVVEVSEEVVVVLVIDVVVDVVVVVVMPGCRAKYLYRIIFYRKCIFLYGSAVNCEYLYCTLMLTKSLVQSLYMTFFFHILSKHL